VSGTIHASCVSIDGRGVLIFGPSGSGKSDLALRLIDRGARLVSDDYTRIRRAGDRLLASAPEAIAGRIEIRGIGIIALPAEIEIPVCLVADLDRTPERLPDGAARHVLLDLAIPAVALAALEASAPIKLERALDLFGLILE
jgi:serine kinase of HPr protein (carbohydrate metabolism regulator)